MVTPTPTPVDPRLLGLSSPWLEDHPTEEDPTKVQGHPDDAHEETEVVPFAARGGSSRPPDPDATERVAMADVTGHLLRELIGPRPSSEEGTATERISDDELPTTLFDRRSASGVPSPREQQKSTDAAIPPVGPRVPRRR